MIYDAFISYSDKNLNFVNDFVLTVESRTLKCWFAKRNVNIGNDYASEIVHAIQQSCVFVLIFTAESNISKHVIREIELAINEDKIIVPIKIPTFEPTAAMRYRLSTVQWIDMNDTLFDIDCIDKLEAIIKAATLRNTKMQPKLIRLNVCKRCGMQYQEHNTEGCTYHTDIPIEIGNTGPREDYKSIWKFNCCGQQYLGTFREDHSDAIPPISPGCKNGKHIPKYI